MTLDASTSRRPTERDVRMKKIGRILSAACVAVAAASSAYVSATPAVAATPVSPAPVTAPAQPNWFLAVAVSVANPDVIPQGMNDFSCKPSAAHPNPVVLVNGTFENIYANWSLYAPQLKAEGYCVFGLNYGGAPGSPIQQTNNMRASGLQLSQFVDQVRAATGAAKVDLVGHSQGGLLPLYYINVLGGADKVATMVGIEPASNGVALYGILPVIAANPLLRTLIGIPLAAANDFTVGSAFLQTTAQGGITRPQVKYTTIISRTDGLITVPEAQLPPASNVTNIVTQDVCPLDFADHVTAVYDDITLRLVSNALDTATAKPPVCHLVLPLINLAPTQPTAAPAVHTS
jgi:triacylglycerol lipase